jgi:two-component system chemotaxis response regulator CheB
VEAEDRSEHRHGHVHVAPPRSRLVIAGNLLRVEKLPEHGTSHHTIDELFRSAAEAYGERVVASLLSGMLSDGTVGLRTPWPSASVAVCTSAPSDVSSGAWFTPPPGPGADRAARPPAREAPPRPSCAG